MTEKLGQEIDSPLLDAVREYKRKDTDSGLVTAFWQAFLTEKGKSIGLSISVPECPWTQTQLKEMKRRNEGPIYLPSEISTQETRHLLGKMFPGMESHSVREGNRVTNEVSRSGWRSFDMSLNAPYLGTTEDKLRRAIASKGNEEPTLNEYIIASQASRLLTGRYLDERTWSRIPGSRHDGDVVRADFDSYGDLDVHSDWGPDLRDPGLGGRSSRGVN